MKENYITNLMNQYIQANHLHFIERSSDEFLHGFVTYIQELKIIGENYSKLIENFGCDIDISSTAEINKGVYDSIAKTNTTIISSYADTMQREASSLIVTDDSIKILSGNKTLDCSNIDTIITQNPYSSSDISLFEKIITLNKYRVYIALYGKCTDKNIEGKILDLKYLKDLYSDSLREIHEKNNNQYLYMLMTK